MTDTCPVCLDDMDMKSFEDERNSTETCVKLDCKHAFHTRCIRTCLSTADKKCPQCNTPKTFEEEITSEGLIKMCVRRFKKQPEVKSLLQEMNIAKKELSGTLKVLREEVRKFIKEKVRELNMAPQRKYFIRCLHKMRKLIKDEATRLGPMYVGVIENDRGWRSRYGGSSVERMIYGCNTWSVYRLKNPYLRMKLF